jgi:hypothetical protein
MTFFFTKNIRLLLNILAEFGIITIAIEMAEDGGPAAHEKLRRARFQASKPKLKIIVSLLFVVCFPPHVRRRYLCAYKAPSRLQPAIY